MQDNIIHIMREHANSCMQAYKKNPNETNYMMWLSLQDVVCALVRRQLRKVKR